MSTVEIATNRHPRVLFVTGRLAEFALRQLLDELGPRARFVPEVAVLPISVAALMTPAWVARRLEIPAGIDRIILPGHCRGDLSPVLVKAGDVAVELGPEDLRDLPRHFGQANAQSQGYGAYDIEILAEINHVPQLSRDALIAQAEQFVRDGADVIDLGCEPGTSWNGVGDAVKALRERGLRVSIDTFDPAEVSMAVAAGAELVLSVNAHNREHAVDWGIEVVAIPEQPGSLTGLDETVNFLSRRGVAYRIDPILEPIGFGFAASLGRYIEVRGRYPEMAIMMGTGNLTELTDVDSAGVNTLLAGICQELAIRSVLTTAVINWARSSVHELDLARRLVHHAVNRHTLPKHTEPRLVMLRDVKVEPFGLQNLAELQKRIRDPNWRIFAENGLIYALNKDSFLSGPDPSALFDRMKVTDPSHAFYLGYELMKAKTALTLGKTYRQDQALTWGFLTEPEESHLARRRSRAKDRASREPGDSGPAHTDANNINDHEAEDETPRVILEGIVTTLSPAGLVNITPMGPTIGPDLSMKTFELRPYRSSTTYQNLKARGEGVFHVTDDVLLLAQAAIDEPLLPAPELRPARCVAGSIIAGSCRYYEFRVTEVDDRVDRARFTLETVAEGRFRDFLGFNRARHAVLEAAILATRIAFLPRDEILSELDRLAVIVTKTGGPDEAAAFRLLYDRVHHHSGTAHLDPTAAGT